MSEPAPKLAAALVAAQAEMPKVPKNGKNPHFHSEFVTLDDLIDHVRPVLAQHGLAFVQLPTDLGDGRPALTTTILHSSGETMTATMPLVLSKQDMQGLGSALTYARRYMLTAALGIAEGADDDGNAASEPSREPAPPFVAPEGATDKAKADREKKRKAMWAEWRKKGLNDNILKAHIKEKFGVESTNDLTPENHKELMVWIKAQDDIPF